MAEDALAKARAIAARLGTITESEVLGKRKLRNDDGEPRNIKKKVYIPVEKYPDINFIGLLIGPRGANQKRMEELSGARILVRGKGSSKDGDPDEHEDLHVIIAGQNNNQVALAQQEVEQILFNPEKAMEMKRHQLAQMNGSGGSNHYGPADGGDDTIEVRPDLVGYIIGRGGETIRQLQEKSGARIRVTREHEEETQKNTRTVHIGGSKPAMEMAKKLINELLAERSNSGGHYGPGDDAITITIPSDKVGLIIGRSGETIRSLQQRTGANIQIPRDADVTNPHERVITISGSEEKRQVAKAEIEALIKNDSRSGITMQIPDNKVGTLIGRGGETIRGIQDRTGVKIQVPNEADPGVHPPTRTLTLMGTADEIAYAKQEVQSLMTQEKSHQRGQYGYSDDEYSKYGYNAQQYAQYYGQQSADGTTAAATADPNDYWAGYYDYAAYYGTEAANKAWGVTADGTVAVAQETPAVADPAAVPPPPGTE